MNLISGHDFLSLDAEQYSLNVQGASAGFYPFSKLKFIIGESSLTIPIIITIGECEVSHLSFKERQVTLEYMVGSGTLAWPIPEV